MDLYITGNTGFLCYIQAMAINKEYLYAEILLDKKIIEGFPNERSPHFQNELEKTNKDKYVKFVRKLNWHINNSLSERQKEVLKLLMKGKTLREIGAILGITHQVVHIYKKRAVKKLRQKLRA